MEVQTACTSRCHRTKRRAPPIRRRRRRRTPPAATAEAPAPRQAARPVNSARGKLIENIVRRLPEGERDGVRAELDKELAEVSPEQLEKAQKVMADPCSEENIRIDVGFLNKYE